MNPIPRATPFCGTAGTLEDLKTARRELMVHFALAIATRATPQGRDRRPAREVMSEAEALADACMAALDRSAPADCKEIEHDLL